MLLRLLQLTVCEKVIIEADGGAASAIGMFETITVELSPNAPEKLLFPMRWCVMGLWRRESEIEEPTEFVQKIIVRSPEDDEVFVAENKFLVSNENVNFRNLVNMSGFPISKTGVVNIEAYVKQSGEDEWKRHFIYPINLVRLTEEKTDENENHAKNAVSVANENDGIASA
jgi:hypothetical protein